MRMRWGLGSCALTEPAAERSLHLDADDGILEVCYCSHENEGALRKRVRQSPR